MKQIPEIFAACPTVYAVGTRYVILVPVRSECVMWVRVGGEEFFDDSNGILRSASTTHKMEVPGALLDDAREYTVCWRKINERKPYFSDVGEIETYTSAFRPVEGENIHIYHIADAHNRVDGPVAAGTFFGEDLDLLVLNGDIPNHSGKIEYFTAIHQIAGQITHGEIPVIFSRGNHDTRGIFAEKIEDHTPTDNGRSYYSVRLGKLWILVLDCGEDKNDDHAEYGHTICCHNFRVRETAFIEKIADDAENEYAAPGVEHRMVIVHNPFTDTFGSPFDIEQELWGHWCELLREKIKPELILCGHVHNCYVTRPGEARDKKGQPCPVVCASKISKNDFEFYIGGALTLSADKIDVKFTDNHHAVVGEDTIDL